MTLKGHSKKLKRTSGFIKFILLSKNYIEPKKSDPYAMVLTCTPQKTSSFQRIPEL